MDTRRSYYLARRQDDFDIPAQDDEGWVDFADIPYVTPANDNIATTALGQSSQRSRGASCRAGPRRDEVPAAAEARRVQYGHPPSRL